MLMPVVVRCRELVVYAECDTERRHHHDGREGDERDKNAGTDFRYHGRV